MNLGCNITKAPPLKNNEKLILFNINFSIKNTIYILLKNNLEQLYDILELIEFISQKYYFDITQLKNKSIKEIDFYKLFYLNKNIIKNDFKEIFEREINIIYIINKKQKMKILNNIENNNYGEIINYGENNISKNYFYLKKFINNVYSIIFSLNNHDDLL